MTGTLTKERGAAAFKGVGRDGRPVVLLDVGDGDELVALQAVDEGAVVAKLQRRRPASRRPAHSSPGDVQRLGVGIDRAVAHPAHAQRFTEDLGGREGDVLRIVEVAQPVGEPDQRVAPASAALASVTS